MKIAIADDEINVRTPLKDALQRECLDVMEFENGLEAWNVVKNLSAQDFPSLFILDIMMPEMDGLELFKKIKNKSPETPIIFLTSRDDEFDKVLGLELGADDYITKPYSIRELIARVHVILRRYKKNENNLQKNILRLGNILLDKDNYTASADGNNLNLTVTEYRILETFAENPKVVFTREQLISIAYPNDVYLNDRAVDCHIKRLRKKVGADVIETVYGLGYRLWEK